MNKSVSVIAFISSNADSIEIVETSLRNAVRNIQNEPGCEVYKLHINSDNTSQFILYEVWSSRELLEKHSKADSFVRLSNELSGKAELSVVFMDDCD
ncbi:putative quinol monooxygenase [Klebsiella oxytoca]|nr:antibiotic biosynthesis monooxygenase [Klebsiella oxytoca]